MTKRIIIITKVIAYSGLIIAICIKWYYVIYLNVLITRIIFGLIIGLPILFLIDFFVTFGMRFFRVKILEKMYPKISEKLKGKGYAFLEYEEFLIKAIKFHKKGFGFKIITTSAKTGTETVKFTSEGPHDWGVEFSEEREYVLNESRRFIVKGNKIKI